MTKKSLVEGNKLIFFFRVTSGILIFLTLCYFVYEFFYGRQSLLAIISMFMLFVAGFFDWFARSIEITILEKESIPENTLKQIKNLGQENSNKFYRICDDYVFHAFFGTFFLTFISGVVTHSKNYSLCRSLSSDILGTSTELADFCSTYANEANGILGEEIVLLGLGLIVAIYGNSRERRKRELITLLGRQLENQENNSSVDS